MRTIIMSIGFVVAFLAAPLKAQAACDMIPDGGEIRLGSRPCESVRLVQVLNKSILPATVEVMGSSDYTVATTEDSFGNRNGAFLEFRDHLTSVVPPCQSGWILQKADVTKYTSVLYAGVKFSERLIGPNGIFLLNEVEISPSGDEVLVEPIEMENHSITNILSAGLGGHITIRPSNPRFQCPE